MTTRTQEAGEKAAGPVDTGRRPALATPTGCCPPEERTSCCEPAAKAACCGDPHVAGCGCR
jgi:hypothetical protein